MAIRAKHFEYWINLDEEGALSADGEPVPLGEGVEAEHLLLAGLARCSVSSLAYFARMRKIETKATAHASGTVTRREDDDRYAFTELEVQMDVDLEPEPDPETLRKLVESAEWGCFVGASLKPAPTYKWRVNGTDL